MRIIEVEPGRWIVVMGGGLELEVQLVAGMAWAWWRWGGELLAEVEIGEG